jgi:uncharacterized membrane protein YheB (UPF0754 family)
MPAQNSYTINKSLVTNLVAILLIALSYLQHTFSTQLFSMGIFALSGAITNWLAIYMLFERVPFLYGSGVIPNQFEQFKTAIKDMMMQQFFTKENLSRLIAMEEHVATKLIDLDPVLDKVDYDQVFQRLVDAILESSFGSMLGMIGGRRALDSLRKPFSEKIRASLKDLANSESFQHALGSSLNSSAMSEDILKHIEQIVDARLQELTPQMVKELVQEMIKKHLGWLVVWGGVFGGLIGLAVSFIP